MVELRKRPAPPSSTAPPPTKRRSSAPSKNDKYSKNNSKPKETKPKAEPLSSTESTDKSKTRVFGDKKYLDGPLGNDVVEGHGGEKMTLRELAERPDGNADIIIKKIKDGWNLTVKLKKNRGKPSSAIPSASAQQTASTPTLASAPSSTKELAAGDVVDFNSDIGSIEVTTGEGESVTLKTLHEQSDGGIIIFTYPKASTPGCTTQAQLFRDSHAALTTSSNTSNNKNNSKNKTSKPTNLSIYGLSTDTPKANSTFKSKHNLPYTLLCDPSGTLVRALGMRNSDPRKKTARRGVVVIGSDGKVRVAMKGGPAATVEAVRAVC